MRTPAPFLQHDTHFLKLSAQRRRQFRYGAFYMPYLREGGVNRFDDVHRHPFDGVLRDAHLHPHHFVDRQVIDRLAHVVLHGGVAQLCRQFQIDRETVADLAFQFVAAVQRPELHPRENDAVLHIIRRSGGSNSSCPSAPAGTCRRSGPLRSPRAPRRRPSPC